MDWDPEEYGANCSQCFLRTRRDGNPVAPEIRENAKFLIVGEMPRQDDVRVGRPFVGKGGLELDRALMALGVDRHEVSVDNAISCRPPDNKFDVVMRTWNEENKQRKKAGEPLLPSPQDCCRPRLLTVIRAHEKDGTVNILSLGKQGATAITQQTFSILESRGGPVNGVLNEKGDFFRYKTEEMAAADRDTRNDDSVQIRLLPSLHPEFVIHRRRWTKAFRADVGRAVRWFGNSLNWVEPRVFWNPPVEFIRDYFKKRKEAGYAFCDIECAPEFPTHKPKNDDYDPLTDRIRCIGVSGEEDGFVVHFLSVDERTTYYSEDDYAEILGLFAEFLRDPLILKIGHNFIYYDSTALKQAFGFFPTPVRDTIIVHKSVESELPHRLAYVASVYTDAPSWKEGDTAKEARTDKDLGVYNVFDCVATGRSWPKLEQIVEYKRQGLVVEKDHQVMEICRGMHENGLYVNHEKRQWHDVELLKEAQKWQSRIRAMIGDKDYNPGSATDVRELIYEKWGLISPPSLKPKQALTSSGLPSTGDDVLLAFRMDNMLTREQLAIIEAHRRYRRAVKLRGTYVMKPRSKYEEYILDPFAYDDGDDGDESTDAEAALSLGEARDFYEARIGKDRKKHGLTLRDNRIHPGYNLGANTGRLSSSGYNALNLQLKMRDMFEPAPGNVFVYADMDQIQLRIIADFAKATGYLKVFNDKGDAHSVTAEAIFRDEWLKLTKDSAEWDRMRTFAKMFSYATAFGAQIETILSVLRSTEDDEGNLTYAKLDLTEAKSRYDAFLERIPLAEWWEYEMDLYRKNGGWLADPVWGRRRDFADGEDRNAILCFRTQATEACIVHEAGFEIVNHIPFGKWGPGTGMVNQNYDSIIVECPAHEAEWTKGVVEHAMNRSVAGFDVKFTAKAKIVKSWYEPICKTKGCKGENGKAPKLIWTGWGYGCPVCLKDAPH